MLEKNWVRSLFRQRVLAIALILAQIALIIYFTASQGTASKVIHTVTDVISVLVSIYVIARKNSISAYKLLWVFVILMFPLFGCVFYFMFSMQTANRKLKKQSANVEKKTKEALSLSHSALSEAENEAPEYAPQMRYLETFAGFPLYKNTETKYLSPGEEMFRALLEELSRAEHYIFLEYFIIQEGQMWNSVLNILKEKAANGVTVRIIYDDIGCFMLLPSDYPKTLKKLGIECAVFNPFRPFLTIRQNNRDHRKIACIDGKVAFTGGINLADEYINEKMRFGHWKDAALMLKGEAAWSYAVMFLSMWEILANKSEDITEYYPRINTSSGARGYVQPYSDSPLDNENVGEQVYLQILQNAKKYVYINTPYLILDELMMSALCLAAKSGIDVRIVTPHIADKKLVHMTTRSYYANLIAAGVKIYEYTNGFIHSKTFVSDDRVATVGSANLDFRSLYLHFECGAFMCDTEAVLAVKEDFLSTLESCTPIAEEDCKGGIFKYTMQNFLRFFAPFM